jgi:Plavaka transposase
MTIGSVLGYERFNRSNLCIRLVGWLPSQMGKASKPEFTNQQAHNRGEEKDSDLKRQAIQYILRQVVKRLEKAELNGINMLCPDGQRRLCHPIICQYIADYPEQCLLSCITYASCPRCTMPRFSAKSIAEPNGIPAAQPPAQKRIKTAMRTAEPIPSRTNRITQPDSGDIFRQYPLRNKIDNNNLREKYKGDAEALKKCQLQVDTPFTDICHYSDIHSIIAPDLLHQVSKMLYDDLFTWIMAYLSISHNVSKNDITNEIDARFSRLPPYPGMKHFAKGISCTQRWTGNEYKAMARVLLPVIQDLLSKEMVALVRAYIHIIQLSHYTSHTASTVEYLRRAIAKYTELRSKPNSPLVTLAILPERWFSPKQHWLQHYPDWIPLHGPLPLCSTDRTEPLHKVHKDDYKKSNKTATYENFLLDNESRKLGMAWFDSTLPPSLVKFPEGLGNTKGKPGDDSDDNDIDDTDDTAAVNGDDDIDDLDDTVVTVDGDTAAVSELSARPSTKIRLGGKRWTDARDLEYVEGRWKLPGLAIETKKRLRWIRSGISDRVPLDDRELDETIEIEGYTLARMQYPAVHDSTEIITEIVRSTEKHEYGKNKSNTASRYDTVLIRWREQQDGDHSMSNRKIGRVLLLFSTWWEKMRKEIHLAYVELFKLATNGWDPKTQTFKVRKTGDCEVIEVESIERGVHLVPCFKGFETQMAAGTREFVSSLDEYKDFWINNWIDRHMYNTIYAEDEMWEVEGVQ